MRSRSVRAVIRRPCDLLIDADVLAEAAALDIDVSLAAEGGMARAVAEEKTRRWKIENAEAIREFNEWVERNGLPLEPYWPFAGSRDAD